MSTSPVPAPSSCGKVLLLGSSRLIGQRLRVHPSSMIGSNMLPGLDADPHPAAAGGPENRAANTAMSSTTATSFIHCAASRWRC